MNKVSRVQSLIHGKMHKRKYKRKYGDTHERAYVNRASESMAARAAGFQKLHPPLAVTDHARFFTKWGQTTFLYAAVAED